MIRVLRIFLVLGSSSLHVNSTPNWKESVFLFYWLVVVSFLYTLTKLVHTLRLFILLRLKQVDIKDSKYLD